MISQKKLDDYDIDCEYFNRGLGDNASVVDCLNSSSQNTCAKKNFR